MSDPRKEMFNRLDELASKAKNYRYAQAQRNLDDLKKFLDNRVEQKTQNQTQGV